MANEEVEDPDDLANLILIYIDIIRRNNMTPIFPRIYCVGKIQSSSLTASEICAFQKSTTVISKVVNERYNILYK